MHFKSTKIMPANEALKSSPTPIVEEPKKLSERLTLSVEENEALRQALAMSFLVYAPPAHVKNELKRCGFEDVEFHSRFYSGAQMLCCSKEGRGYVAFRGSASILDWIVDLLIIPFLFWPFRHFGFEWAWRSMRRPALAWLDKTDLNDLVLTGHSLGGAMAHMAAFFLAKEHNIANVFTFGAPKACYGSTAKKLTETKILGDTARPLGALMYSVINQRDIVAKVPFQWLGYRDVGQLIYIDAKDDVYVREEAERKRDDDTMHDMNFVLNFLSTENKVYQGLELPENTIKYYAKQGWFWLGQYLPQVRLAITFPVLYVLTCFYFLSSGLNHMTGQYIRVFYAPFAPMAFVAARPSKFGQITGMILRALVIGLTSVLFFWGLYEVCVWAISSIGTTVEITPIHELH